MDFGAFYMNCNLYIVPLSPDKTGRVYVEEREGQLSADKFVLFTFYVHFLTTGS